MLVTSNIGGNYGKVYEALGAGGLDVRQTPSFGPGGAVQGGQPILDRLTLLSQLKEKKPKAEAAAIIGLASSPTLSSTARLPPLVAIGASTGGPAAVAQVLASMGPKLLGPVIVIQHIAADFAVGLASWLQSLTNLPVTTAREGIEPIAGQVYVAASNDHLILNRNRRFEYTADPKSCPYRPSVDAFFESLATAWPQAGWLCS